LKKKLGVLKMSNSQANEKKAFLTHKVLQAIEILKKIRKGTELVAFRRENNKLTLFQLFKEHYEQLIRDKTTYDAIIEINAMLNQFSIMRRKELFYSIENEVRIQKKSLTINEYDFYDMNLDITIPYLVFPKNEYKSAMKKSDFYNPENYEFELHNIGDILQFERICSDCMSDDLTVAYDSGIVNYTCNTCGKTKVNTRIEEMKYESAKLVSKAKSSKDMSEQFSLYEKAAEIQHNISTLVRLNEGKEHLKAAILLSLESGNGPFFIKILDQFKPANEEDRVFLHNVRKLGYVKGYLTNI